MKKYLLIPILLIGAAMTSYAHCGSCGTEKSHDKSAETTCAKEKCDEAKTDCDKAKCDEAPAKKAPAKDACCPAK